VRAGAVAASPNLRRNLTAPGRCGQAANAKDAAEEAISGSKRPFRHPDPPVRISRHCARWPVAGAGARGVRRETPYPYRPARGRPGTQVLGH